LLSLQKNYAFFLWFKYERGFFAQLLRMAAHVQANPCWVCFRMKPRRAKCWVAFMSTWQVISSILFIFYHHCLTQKEFTTKHIHAHTHTYASFLYII
jgi:hypothetical protein